MVKPANVMKHIVLRFAKKIDKYISHWNVKKCQQFYISHVKSTHHSPDISWHPVSNNVMQPFIFLRMHFLLPFLFPFCPQSNAIRIKPKISDRTAAHRFDKVLVTLHEICSQEIWKIWLFSVPQRITNDS